MRLDTVEEGGLSGVACDVVSVTLDVEPRVGVILAAHTDTVEVVVRDDSTRRILLDVDGLGGDVRADAVADNLVEVRVIANQIRLGASDVDTLTVLGTESTSLSDLG